MDPLRRLTDRTDSFNWVKAFLIWGALTVVLAVAFSMASERAPSTHGLFRLLAFEQEGAQWAGSGSLSASASPISQLIR